MSGTVGNLMFAGRGGATDRSRCTAMPPPLEALVNGGGSSVNKTSGCTAPEALRHDGENAMPRTNNTCSVSTVKPIVVLVTLVRSDTPVSGGRAVLVNAMRAQCNRELMVIRAAAHARHTTCVVRKRIKRTSATTYVVAH